MMKRYAILIAVTDASAPVDYDQHNRPWDRNTLIAVNMKLAEYGKPTLWDEVRDKRDIEDVIKFMHHHRCNLGYHTVYVPLEENEALHFKLRWF